MYGAILGDIIGSPYEFDDQNIKTKVFPLFSEDSRFTDDSVLTIAVAEALMDAKERGIFEDVAGPYDKEDCDGKGGDEEIKRLVTESLVKWGNRYPYAGYGRRFVGWLADPSGPYNSLGNGSAMRVSSAGWLFDDLEKAERAAELSAAVTHDHPEGIKGAKSVASAIYMARTGASKEEIKDYITRNFGYDLTRTCDEIRPGYHHVETCMGTVPEAVTAFLEGEGFEDVIRTAVSLGGDCDTLTCIAGSMAEAYYGVPDDLKEECRKRVTGEMNVVLRRFEDAVRR